MIRQDSVLCKNCRGNIKLDINMDSLDENEDCPCVRVDVECPHCKEKHIASCWFDYVGGSWHEDGIALRKKE